ncbi:MAG: hypothetical protein Q9M40_07085 [Sulfurimonas sp.]|nr:hypothetical protein [Sulfurimonas sp.]MDQ7067738.1 hypothetical protein [Sulfurimonas sp.]
MGKEIKEDVVAEMEDVLGITDEAPVVKEEATEVIEPKETKEETPPVTPTTSLTDEQLTLNQDMTKLDIEIDTLEKETVDTTSFYDNLETELSEDEQALEFSDKSAYMKLVNTKANEYETKNSKATEIETLKEKKQEMTLEFDRQSAIVEVSAKYPDYKHEDILNYFTQELSQVQQQEIHKDATSYADIYERTYKAFKGATLTDVKNEPAPTIPNVNKIRKNTVKSEDVDNGLQSEDELLQSALGL